MLGASGFFSPHPCMFYDVGSRKWLLSIFHPPNASFPTHSAQFDLLILFSGISKVLCGKYVYFAIEKAVPDCKEHGCDTRRREQPEAKRPRVRFFPCITEVVESSL